MRPDIRRTAITMAVFLAVLAGGVASTVRVKGFTHREYLYQSLYLPSGKFMEQASLGYNQITADMIWFSAVQYYGGFRKGDHDLAYFRGLIDLVTDLDPHFIFPYVFGAVVMSQDMDSFDSGIQLLRKGMHHNPTSWELPFEIGFLSLIDRRNHDMAARYFDLASRLPGAPDRARRFAAFVYSQAGHEELSIRMWEELKETTSEPFMKDLADHYLKKLYEAQKSGGGVRDERG